MSLIFLLSLAAAHIFPQQIHLSWTENPSEIRLTWLSRLSGKVTVSISSPTCAVPTLSPIQMTRFDFGSEFPRFSYIYTMTMQGVHKSCTYDYQIYIGYIPSQKFSFNGWTPGQSLEEGIKIIIYGDLGISSESLAILKTLKSYTEDNYVTGIIHLGDLAYDLNTDQGQVGDQFGLMIEPLSAEIPYMTLPGNHEISSNYSHYSSRYLMPKTQENEGLSLFYSFEGGHVKYILINTNVFYTGTEEEKLTQLNWLKTELKKAENNRESVPWVVMLQHHPLYCSHQIGDEKSEDDCLTKTKILRGYLEGIYKTFKVDLVIQGHMHLYERESAIFNDTDFSGEYDTQDLVLNAQAPVYLITGNGGNNVGRTDPLISTPSGWQRKQFISYGFGALTCFNRTHLLWEQFNSGDMKRLDYFYLVKTS